MSQKTYLTRDLMAGYNSTLFGIGGMGWLTDDHEVVNAMWPKFFGWYWHHIVSTMMMAQCESALKLRLGMGVPVCESDYYTKDVDSCEPTF